MDKKYQEYSIEEFTQDPEFIRWVNRGIARDEWEDFVAENPHLKKKIEAAREIVTSFRTRENKIEDEEIFTLWKKIRFFHLLHQKQIKKKRKRRNYLRYAAIFILAFTIGASFPYFYFKKNHRQFTEINVPAPSTGNEAKLILADGKEVLLKKKQTELQFNTAGSQVKINRDSIINYKGRAKKNALNQIIIPFGKRSNIELSDGTKVWLNAGSRLMFPQKFEGKERKVFLVGEAFFDVAHNKHMPFIVKTNSMNIRVLGTEFNLRDDISDDKSEVVLVRGSISLKENNVLNLLSKEIKLKPNQKAVYDKQSNETKVDSDVDVEYYTCWKDGLLECRHESILNVFKRLSKYYNVHFITERSVELSHGFNGKLDLKDSIEDVLKVIADAAPITYKIEGDKIYIDSKINYLPMK